jgi:hypothetical protein
MRPETWAGLAQNLATGLIGETEAVRVDDIMSARETAVRAY